MWQRAFRRTALPLAYTQVLSPRPKVSFGLALPTGHHSLADDVRSAIVSIAASATEPVLMCELASEPRGLRPSEMVTAIAPGLEEARVRRLHQWIQRDGASREPLEVELPLDATDAPHAWER